MTTMMVMMIKELTKTILLNFLSFILSYSRKGKRTNIFLSSIESGRLMENDFGLRIVKKKLRSTSDFFLSHLAFKWRIDSFFFFPWDLLFSIDNGNCAQKCVDIFRVTMMPEDNEPKNLNRLCCSIKRVNDHENTKPFRFHFLRLTARTTK